MHPASFAPLRILRDQLQVWSGGARFVGVPARPAVQPDGAVAPGLFVVGDLLDAPLIGAAMHAGARLGARLALEAAAHPSTDPSVLDVLVVGAGPAGASAALPLKRAGLRFALIDQHDAFATIDSLPPGKPIYAEGLSGPPPLPFADGTKEQQVAAWRAALTAAGVQVESGTALTALHRIHGLFTAQLRRGSTVDEVRARRVVLAIGRRGSPNPLPVRTIEGEAPRTSLGDASAFAGRRCTVVGGGDSAAEAAMALCDAGAQVHLLIRGDGLNRARPRNQARVASAVATGAIQLWTRSEVVARSASGILVLRDGAEHELPCDHIFAMLGATAPYDALRQWGVPIEGDHRWSGTLAFVLFASIIYMFYVLKSGLTLFPFGPGDPLQAAPAALTVHIADRQLGPSFWGTVLYTLAVMGFGLRSLRAHPSAAQRSRLLGLIAFQVVLLFAVPELLAPLVLDRPWKVYALTVPWPLSLWSLIDAPSWAGGDHTAAIVWIGLGALVSFVAIPLYVRRHGLAFCSRLCGCGALAETAGDTWRSRAPRGAASRQTEWASRAVLFAAIPTTALILLDAWGLGGGALGSAKTFAQRWYSLVVDFGLASLVGVALYPALGNRAWCRFFCPLRAYMELLARLFARPQIVADSRCIGCAACTRACQMGIDVQRFAQTGTPLHNGNSSCIQCGVCVEVCPMDVLVLDRDRPVQLRLDGLGPSLPPWERR